MRRILPIPDLPTKLGALIDQIPRGRVTTPGRLAAALGNSVAARWIGHYLLHHTHSADCNCHRVVRAGGVLGAHPLGVTEKARMLAAEGVEVAHGRVDERLIFNDFASEHPLRKLAAYQNRLAKKVLLRARRGIPPLIGGVDVSYCGADEGVAAYALVETASGKLVWSTTIRRAVRFPYITSYLTFRELPLLIELIAEVRAQDRLSRVVLVDGTGVLHPRRAGIASHLAVVTGVPTIGVTKKLLCGQVDIKNMRSKESRAVMMDGVPVGEAIRPTYGSLRPLFISPGSGLDLRAAMRIVRAVLGEKRLPLPLYWADRLSRQHAKSLRQIPNSI